MQIDCGCSFRIKLALTAEPDITSIPTEIVLILDRAGSMACRSAKLRFWDGVPPLPATRRSRYLCYAFRIIRKEFQDSYDELPYRSSR